VQARFRAGAQIWHIQNSPDPLYPLRDARPKAAVAQVLRRPRLAQAGVRGRNVCARIVLHADDFGLSAAVSAGIVRGFTHGLLTSTSLLANAPHAAGAIASWKALTLRQAEGTLDCPLRDGLDVPGRRFDLGIHVNLTQGRPLTAARYPAALLDRDGRFPGIFGLFYRLLHDSIAYRAALAAELSAQIAFLADHGLRPTHLNGHQYVEMLPPVTALLPELLSRFAIPTLRVAVEPALARTTLVHQGRLRAWLLAVFKRRYARALRACSLDSPVAWPEVFFGTAHAGRIDAGVMKLFLAQARKAGAVEIGMHPGYEDRESRQHEIDNGWSDPLSSLRPRELELLQSAVFAQQLRKYGATLGRLSPLGEAAPRRAA
jgi:chitin disaccharide deacetylase